MLYRVSYLVIVALVFTCLYHYLDQGLKNGSYYHHFLMIPMFLGCILAMLLSNAKDVHQARTHIYTSTAAKLIFAEKLSKLEDYFLKSDIYLRLFSFLYNDCIDLYADYLRTRYNLFAYPIAVVILSIQLNFTIGIYPAVIFAIMHVLMTLVQCGLSKVQDRAKEDYVKCVFMRRFILYDHLYYFRELTYCSLNDLFVKRLLYNKIQEEEMLSKTGTYEKAKELISDLIVAAQFILPIIVGTVYPSTRLGKQNVDSLLSVLLYLGVVIISVSMSYGFTKAFQTRSQYLRKLNLFDITLELASIDKKFNISYANIYDRLEEGQIAVEQNDLRSNAQRVFRTDGTAKLFEYFGLNIDNFLNYLEKNSNFTIDPPEEAVEEPVEKRDNPIEPQNIASISPRARELGQVGKCPTLHVHHLNNSISKDVDGKIVLRLESDMSPRKELMNLNNLLPSTSQCFSPKRSLNPSVKSSDMHYNKSYSKYRDGLNISDNGDNLESDISSMSLGANFSRSTAAATNTKVKFQPGEFIGLFSKITEIKQLRVVVDCLLNECKLKNNNIVHKGDISYVNFNEPYFLVGKSISDNIIFGDPYKSDRYTYIINTIKLTFERFVGGEMMKIGDDGRNLSSIEKNLILLARLLYKEREIYVIENYINYSNTVKIISYKKIFENVLKGKTVIFVSNDRTIEPILDRVFIFSKTGLHQTKFDPRYRSNPSTKSISKDDGYPWRRQNTRKYGSKEGSIMLSNTRDVLFINNNDFKLELKILKEYEQKRKMIQDVFKDKPVSDQVLYGIYLVAKKIREGDKFFNPFSKSFQPVDLMKEVFTKAQRFLLYFLWVVEIILKYCLYLIILFTFDRSINIGNVVINNNYFSMLSRVHSIIEEVFHPPDGISWETKLWIITLAILYAVCYGMQRKIYHTKIRDYCDSLHDKMVQKLVNLTPMAFEEFKRETIIEVFSTHLGNLEVRQFKYMKRTWQALIESIIIAILLAVVLPAISTVLVTIAVIYSLWCYKKLKKSHFDCLRILHERRGKLKEYLFYNLKTIVHFRIMNCNTDILKHLSRLIDNYQKAAFTVNAAIPVWLQTRTRFAFMIMFFLTLASLSLLRGRMANMVANIIVLLSGYLWYNVDSFFHLWFLEQSCNPSFTMINRFIAFNRLRGQESSNREESIRLELYGNIKVAFKKVSLFSYQRAILRELNFSLSHSYTYALIGLDQLAKQSIFNLIMGFHIEDDSGSFLGEVLAKDSESARNYKSIANFKNHHYYLMQEPIFFEGTIRDNLIVSEDNDFSEEYVLLLLKLFGAGRYIDDWPELPDANKIDSSSKKERQQIIKMNYHTMGFNEEANQLKKQGQHNGVARRFSFTKSKFKTISRGSGRSLQEAQKQSSRKGNWSVKLYNRMSTIFSKDNKLKEKYNKMRESRMREMALATKTSPEHIEREANARLASIGHKFGDNLSPYQVRKPPQPSIDKLPRSTEFAGTSDEKLGSYGTRRKNLTTGKRRNLISYPRHDGIRRSEETHERI